MFESSLEEFKSFDEKLFLIDFGISSKFLKDGLHKEQKKSKSF